MPNPLGMAARVDVDYRPRPRRLFEIGRRVVMVVDKLSGFDLFGHDGVGCGGVQVAERSVANRRVGLLNLVLLV